MNPPNSVFTGETDALGGDLRPCSRLPRPIPLPPESQIGPIRGAR